MAENSPPHRYYLWNISLADFLLRITSSPNPIDDIAGCLDFSLTSFSQQNASYINHHG